MRPRYNCLAECGSLDRKLAAMRQQQQQQLDDDEDTCLPFENNPHKQYVAVQQGRDIPLRGLRKPAPQPNLYKGKCCCCFYSRQQVVWFINFSASLLFCLFKIPFSSHRLLSLVYFLPSLLPSFLLSLLFYSNLSFAHPPPTPLSFIV